MTYAEKLGFQSTGLDDNTWFKPYTLAEEQTVRVFAVSPTGLTVYEQARTKNGFTDLLNPVVDWAESQFGDMLATLDRWLSKSDRAEVIGLLALLNPGLQDALDAPVAIATGPTPEWF